MIEWNDYASEAVGTAIYPGRGMKLGLLYATQGLRGEAGEVCEHGKKMLRDDAGQLTSERRGKLQKELGDVCWYAASVAFEARFELGKAVIRDIKNYPEQLTYTGRGTVIGTNYAMARLHSATAKVGDYALYVMPHVLEDGDVWVEKLDQGRVIQGNIRTALSHVMFWVMEVCASTDLSLDMAMRANLEKLADRKARGVLQGGGSNR
jgi:NTP pyrophosphatase (non-canonical NTP hydrolase)